MSWYLNAIKKYATFKGRARRKEYWMFLLFNLIFMAVAVLLDSVTGLSFKIQDISMGYGIISVVYLLFTLLPGLALLVRRMHDQDKSGGWIFITLVPAIGSIWMLILMFTPGTVGQNRFGEDPKAGEVAAGQAAQA
jgi:uncharacterized membrane protein YhaH (DUF805 family)